MKIRTATFDDCADIHRVQDGAIRGIHANKPMDKGVADYLEKRGPSSYAKEMEHERFVVVEEGGKIVGYGALNLAKTEIKSVFVDPVYQRTGVGRAILSALEELAQREGLETVQLQATGTAIVFYLATGYQSDPPVEPGVEWALMKKKLC
jgi:N-acetylglutamate synthase-like GNAT family acetyltransferase